MRDAPSAAPLVAAFVADVEALAPLIRSHADENERERRLAAPVVDALRARGLFRVMLPARFGGAGLSILDAMPIFEAAAYEDGSTGWNLAIGAGTASFLLLLDDAAELEALGKDPALHLAGSINPMGVRLVRDGDGFRASGRLTYASGVSQSTWLVAGALLMADGRPVPTPGGGPTILGAFFPTAEAAILDTWRTSGLAGTGSHDVVVEDVFVPRGRTFDFLGTQPHADEPLAAIPLPSRLGSSLVSVGVGIARRAIDELVAIGGRRPFPAPRELRERASAQVDLGRACGLVDAARAHVVQVVGAVFAKVLAGDAASVDDSVRMRLAYVTATESLARAVDLVRGAAGMSGIAAGSPLDRCWRDVHALTQHFALGAAQFERMGKIRFGLDPGPGPI